MHGICQYFSGIWLYLFGAYIYHSINEDYPHFSIDETMKPARFWGEGPDNRCDETSHVARGRAAVCLIQSDVL